MISSVVAQRYAQALYDEAEGMPSVAVDVRLLSDTLDSSAELDQCLKSPVVPRRKKSAILQGLFAGRVQELTLRFVLMLVERGRESLLRTIAARFLALTDKAQGAIEVRVRAYSALSEREQEHLRGVLGKSLNKTVRLDVVADPALMGGIVLEIGDTVYDGSVRHQLSLLRSRLHAQS